MLSDPRARRLQMAASSAGAAATEHRANDVAGRQQKLRTDRLIRYRRKASPELSRFAGRANTAKQAACRVNKVRLWKVEMILAQPLLSLA